MKNMHENQTKILNLLLETPEGCTLQQLSEHLDITKTATKEHVVKLIHFGYISHKDIKGHVGRPKRIYLLTESGQEVFPRQYSWISILLLEYLVEHSSEQHMSNIMEQLAEKVTDSLSARLEKNKLPADRLKEMTTILNELGYRSQLKQSDLRKGAVLEATNCVYHGIAKQHNQLCQFDIHLIEKMSHMDTCLQRCIAKGDSVCRFYIKNKE